jgi:class 3 adenylate cyclase/tetratricopeptide (TPR) repeat protein
MVNCPNCGAANPPQAKFCSECGTPLPAHEEPTEVRKVVSLVFCDLTGSTALGEKMDPESLRRVQARYFKDMTEALERHGGTIEKYIGDAVMAVFGIPVLHEDDALRAVRAAADMQQAMGRLEADLIRDYGRGVKARIGVNTGEVIAGDSTSGHGFATGDTVNVAARFEQAAPSGEILIGEETYRRVRDWVEVEPVEPLELKGKSERMPAFRLVKVLQVTGPARHSDEPFVGRERELARMGEVFNRAVEEKSCHLVTVLGPAGVGKSRITTEFVEWIADKATVATGSCLPYGDGITFWPLAEAVKDTAGVTDADAPDVARKKIRDVIGADPDAEIIVSRIETALGLVDAAAEAQELFWAVRRFFETSAAHSPMVVIFDDIHWAEPTFLDLIEYLIGWSKGVPILVVCLARNEFLEGRPTWSSGQANATTIALEPLAKEDAEELIEQLVRAAEIPLTLKRQIVEATEGNPLFVGETIRMMIDDGVLIQDGEKWKVAAGIDSVSVPGSIQALVAARIDRLDNEERQVIGRGSVIGRVFWWSAISQLTPSNLRSTVASHLQTLVRRELIAPEQSSFPGEDAFKFSSALVTDAAYQGMAKKLRADLHEAFTKWLEHKAGPRLREFEEILGYHLERAYTYRKELGALDDSGRDLAERAAEVLGSAGRRALARSDMPGAANLLTRAVNVLDDKDPRRVELLLDLFAATMETEGLEKAGETLTKAVAAAGASGDDRLKARAAIQHRFFEEYSESVAGWKDAAIATAKKSIATFEAAGDEVGLTQAYLLMAEAYWTESHYGQVERILDSALDHAQKSGSAKEETKILGWLPYVAFWGPTHAEQSLKLCEAVLKLGEGNRMVEGKTILSMAGLEAMRGDFDRARELVARAMGIFEELGLGFTHAAARQMSGLIEDLAGDPAAAEREYRLGYDALEAMGDKGYLPSFAAYVGESLYDQGRYDEAERFTTISEEMFAADDEEAKADWGPVRAKLLLRTGDEAGAIRLAQEVVSMASANDDVFDHADALMDLAEILRTVGRTPEAATAAAQGLELFEKKGVVCEVDRARKLVDELKA